MKNRIFKLMDMDFKVGDRVKRKKGSRSIGIIEKIYKETHYVTGNGEKRLLVSKGDCAVRFENNSENATIPFSPIELEKV